MPAAGRKTQFFHLTFTEPRAHHKVHPCTACVTMLYESPASFKMNSCGLQRFNGRLTSDTMTDFSDCLKAKSFMPASRSRALKPAYLLSFKTIFYPSLKIREDSCPSFRLRQKVPGSVMFQQCPVHSGEGLEGPARSPGAAGSEGPAGVPWGRGPAWTQRGHGRARTAGTLGLKRRQGKPGMPIFPLSPFEPQGPCGPCSPMSPFGPGRPSTPGNPCWPF